MSETAAESTSPAIGKAAPSPEDQSNRKRQCEHDSSTPSQLVISVPKLPPPPPQWPAVPKNFFSSSDVADLFKQCDEEVRSATADLNDARIIAERAGLTVDSSILDPSFKMPLLSTVHTSSAAGGGAGLAAAVADKTDFDVVSSLLPSHITKPVSHNPQRGTLKVFPSVLSTTGGHSNTDHVVQYTGDAKTDRISELKRALKRRARAMKPEERGEVRWDQPRLPGRRRRRIAREKDLPVAPPEPPSSGYVMFVGQMTTKIRHDRPKEPHSQTKASQEISKIWKYAMSDAEREYYNELAREARSEYEHQHREYRATGRYCPSRIITKLDGGPWVRVAHHEKNALEKEIATYKTVKFPPRPPELDEAYKKREEESKRRRRLKEKEKAKAETLKAT